MSVSDLNGMFEAMEIGLVEWIELRAFEVSYAHGGYERAEAKVSTLESWQTKLIHRNYTIRK